MDNIPNEIGVDIEITMSNMIPHTYYLTPRNFRT